MNSARARDAKIRVALGMSFLIAFSLPGQSIDPESTSVQSFHKVSEHIFRGALPSPAGLQALSKLGIATILDLRGESERTSSEEDQVNRLGMHYLSVPMHGLRTPTKDEIERGIHILQDPKNWPIFVHCRYGVDRTGTLIACYRIQAESWPNEMARKEAEDLGMHSFERGMKKFILNFEPERGVRSSPTSAK